MASVLFSLGVGAQDPPFSDATAIAPSVEEGAPSPEEADDFEVRWTPYLWAPGISGETGMGGAVADVDIEFTDVLEKLDGAATSYLRVFKSRWSFTLDTSFVKVSGEADVQAETVVPVSGSVPTQLGPFPISLDVPVNIEAEADYELTSYFFESFVGYQVWGDRFAPRSAPPTLAERFAVDLLVGARYVEMDAKLDLDTVLTVGPIATRVGSFGPVTREHSASFEHEESWVDPLIGAQVDFAMTEALAFSVRGDIGGFGVGSDFSWGLLAGAKYDFSELTSAYAGYRILDIDYDDEDFVFDAQIGGPILGVMFRF